MKHTEITDKKQPCETMGAVGARRLFDAYMAVDWSARDTPSPRQPSRDAIWLAHQAARLELTATAYVRTRQECFEQLRGLVDRKSVV